MNALALSVVIPTYNRVNTLRAVLPTLLDQTLSADVYEIVIADSHSLDGTADYVEEMRASAGERLRYLPGAYTGRLIVGTSRESSLRRRPAPRCRRGLRAAGAVS